MSRAPIPALVSSGKRGAGLAPAFCLGLLLLGCSRPSPYLEPVDAASPIGFAMWRTDMDPLLTSEEWAWFDRAIQEFKFQTMLSGAATGSEAIDAAVREKINGHKLADLVREGLRAYLKRKTADQDALEQAIVVNSKLRVRPDDEEKLRELAEYQENLKSRLTRLKEEVAAAQADLTQFEAKAR